jgi:hypothetical protein
VPTPTTSLLVTRSPAYFVVVVVVGVARVVEWC